MIRAPVLSLVAFSLPLLGAAQAHATEGFFFCAEVVDDACTQWVSIVEGIVSLDELGITPSDIIELMGYGFGVVISLFTIGLVAGHLARSFKNITGDEAP